MKMWLKVTLNEQKINYSLLDQMNPFSYTKKKFN